MGMQRRKSPTCIHLVTWDIGHLGLHSDDDDDDAAFMTSADRQSPDTLSHIGIKLHSPSFNLFLGFVHAAQLHLISRWLHL